MWEGGGEVCEYVRGEGGEVCVCEEGSRMGGVGMWDVGGRRGGVGCGMGEAGGRGGGV